MERLRRGFGGGAGAGAAARLNAMLDAEPDGAAQAHQEGSPMVDVVEDPVAAAAAEHEARVKAEGAAAHANSRLAVFQDQMGEWSAARDAEAAAAAAAAGDALVAARAAAAASAGSPGEAAAAAAVAAAAALADRLAATAKEAAAFAALAVADAERAKRSLSAANLGGSGGGGGGSAGGGDGGDSEGGGEDGPKRARGGGRASRRGGTAAAAAEEANGAGAAPLATPPSTTTTPSASSLAVRARSIPLRLTPEERRTLALLTAALSVSQYTDRVDILSWRSKAGRVVAQIKEVCATLCGLVVASDFKAGQALLGDRDFVGLGPWFADVFEVGRRYKIACPEAMRGEYGKLIYLLQDSVDPAVRELLGFDCVRPLRTVWTLLEEGGGAAGLALLDDPLLPGATAEIDGTAARGRAAIQRDIRAKEAARASLARKYASATLPEADVLRALYSLSDAAAFLGWARDPVDRMLSRLEATFDGSGAAPSSPSLSLAIHGGSNGARLTHSHARQFVYVRQSLVLWRELMDALFGLWAAAEADLLAPGNPYRLCDTGQGLNRVQAAPKTGRAMGGLLGRVQARLGPGQWVGSSVVHLGDHNVPNALLFIHKYVGVPAILNPVVAALEALPGACEADPEFGAYVARKWGGVEPCATAILADFFKHAFDGSGADSWFDAGSCIDGRLTSAWSWTDQWQKKPYANVLRVCGVTGFSDTVEK